MDYDKELNKILTDNEDNIAHGQLFKVAVDELRSRLLESVEINISRARIMYLVTNNGLLMDFKTSPDAVKCADDVEKYKYFVKLSIGAVIKRLEQSAIETQCTITEDVIIHTIKNISFDIF